MLDEQLACQFSLDHLVSASTSVRPVPGIGVVAYAGNTMVRAPLEGWEAVGGYVIVVGNRYGEGGLLDQIGSEESEMWVGLPHG